MEQNRENIRYDLFEACRMSTNITAKELVEEGTVLLNASASACIGRCEVLNGEALVEGTVRFCAICKKDGIKKYERTERFTLNEKLGAQNGTLIAKAEAGKVRGYIEAGNLMLTSEITVTGTAVIPVEKELLVSLGGNDVRLQEEEIQLDSVKFNIPLRFAQTCSSTLSPRVPEPKEILCAAACVDAREVHISAGQLIIGGEIMLQTVYSSDDGYEPIVQLTDKCEFSYIADIADAGEIENADASLCAENISVSVEADENGEARKLIYTCELCGYAFGTEHFSVNTVRDAYSTKERFECKKDKLRHSSFGEKTRVRLDARISVKVPETKPTIARLHSAVFIPGTAECKFVHSKAVFGGTGEVSVIYMASGTGETEGFNAQVPFELACDGMRFDTAEKAIADISLTDMQAAMISGTEIELRIAFEADIFPYSNEEKEIVDGISISETDDMPEFGIIVYNVGASESLWDICKKFGVDESDVRSLNPELGDVPERGDKIFIFRRLAV